MQSPENKIDLLSSLKSGELDFFKLKANNLEEIKAVLGDNFEEGYKNRDATFYYWNNVQVCMNGQNSVEYVDLLFSNRQTASKEFVCDAFGDKIVFKEEISFGKLIKLLNFEKIPFTITNSPEPDIIEITVSESISILLRIEDTILLDRITFKKPS
jgi:hypothetical protein